MKWKELNRSYSNSLEELKAKTPYEILRVSPSASLDEIKAAYRKLVRAYHPDSSDNFMKNINEEILVYINLAYEKIFDEKHK
ncbi:MAG: DnaJ domain-containing protein [Flavobacteriales bacterium]|nr:DnaJ domain-containing protein [Flavobacteriales bacterium]